MKKAAQAFRSIGEVSQLVGVAPHVLRYWETQFPLFSPVKRRDGRRYYRPDDLRIAAGLCELLREDGMSIRGAKKQMSSDRGASLKIRGAARLGGEFALDADAAAPAQKMNGVANGKLAGNGAVHEGDLKQASAASKLNGEKSVKKSKAKPKNMQDTLPLFPDMHEDPQPASEPDLVSAELQSPAEPERAAAKVNGTATPLADTTSGSVWLGRLNSICIDLRDTPSLPAVEAQAVLARMKEVRASLRA